MEVDNSNTNVSNITNNNNVNDNNTLSDAILLGDLASITEFDKLLNSDNYDSLKLKKIKYKSNFTSQQYNIIKYSKDFLRLDDFNTYGLCRSIIVDKNNKVLSVAPQKSMNYDNFINKYPSENYGNDTIIAQEFVEGTMINVFWDQNIGLYGSWEIATRNTIGANCSFYKNDNRVSEYSKTFKDMFLEALNTTNLHLELLNKNYCYSFVLQHPENRIVVPFNQISLYLVGVYLIKSHLTHTFIYSMNIYDKFYNNNFLCTTIKLPKVYEYNSYEELVYKYASLNTPYYVMGFVLYNVLTGERTKCRNPVYERIRQLKGNQPKLQYHYICLRQNGLVNEYLKYYPENKSEFSVYRDSIHLFTNVLYSNYVSCYIKKIKPLGEYSKQFRTLMFNLHNKFIDELKPQGNYITKNVVINYINNLQPSLLMYYLNYGNRQCNMDFVCVDSLGELYK